MVNYTPIHNRKPTKKQLAQINAFKKRKAAAFGGDYQAYLKSKQPPLSPTKAALYSLKRSSTGDKDYERDLILSDPYLKKADKKFWRENDKWFNPDGSRRYSDPEDQKAWDRLQGKNIQKFQQKATQKVAEPVVSQEPKVAPFQLPTMMAPIPGARHMLFNGYGSNSGGINSGGNRPAFMNSAFSNPVNTGATPIQNQNSGYVPPNQTGASIPRQAQGIPIPSNLNRFYALQAGAQQTPYANLITDHVLKTNVKRGNPKTLNTPINPYPFNGAGYGVTPPTSFGSAFNPMKHGRVPFGGVNPGQLGQIIS